MTIQLVTSPDAPAAIGPYSHAAVAGGLLFVSGQLPIIPATGDLIVDDIDAAFRQCIANAAAVLAARRLTLDDVAKVTVFLTDLADFPIVNEAYAELFGAHEPARSTMQVAALPRGAAVEVELTAEVTS